MADEITPGEPQRTTIDWKSEPMHRPEYFDGINDRSIANNLKSIAKKLPPPGTDIQTRQAVNLIVKATQTNQFQASPILRSTELAGIIPRRKEIINGREVSLYDRSAIVVAVILAGTEDFEPIRSDSEDFDTKGFFDMDKTAQVRIRQLGNHTLRGLMHRRFVDGKEVYVTSESSVKEMPFLNFEPEIEEQQSRLIGKWELTEEQNQSLIEMQLDHKAREFGNPEIPLNLFPLLRNWNEVRTGDLIKQLKAKPKDQPVSFDHDFDYPSYKALQLVIFSDHKLPFNKFPLSEERQLTAGQLINYVMYLQRKLKVESVENQVVTPSLEDIYLKTMQQS